MFEVNAFLTMFAVQIIVLTILLPIRLTRRVRMVLARYPADQFPVHPLRHAGVEHRLKFFQLLNAAIAVAGLAMLLWFFNYMHLPDWDDGPVETLAGVYFVLQLVPLVLCAWAGERTNKLIRDAFPQEARKASLQRRGLFDFVSPFVVGIAALCYLLFIAFVFWIKRHPFPGFAGPYVNIGFITVLYAVTAFCVYKTLYGRKRNPLQTHADRMRTIEVIVKICVYTCVASVVFLSLNFTLVLLDMQSWEPLVQSIGNVTCALLYSLGLGAMPINPPQIDGLNSRPAA